jgi:hypothetical protein
MRLISMLFKEKKYREKCTISPYCWPNIQIAPCSIKVNLELPVIGLIYKSLSGVKFR